MTNRWLRLVTPAVYSVCMSRIFRIWEGGRISRAKGMSSLAVTFVIELVST